MDSLKEVHFAIGVVEIVISISGLVGNLITLTLLVKNKVFHNIKGIMGNLAMADFLSSCLGLMAGIGYIDKSLTQTNGICYVTIYLWPFTRFLSFFSLIFLSLKKYNDLVKRINAFYRITENASTYIILSWTLALVVSLSFNIHSNNPPRFSPGEGVCLFKKDFPLFPIHIISLIFFPPGLCLLVYCNIRIWWRIYTQNKLTGESNVISEARAKLRNRKVSKMVATIVTTFLICRLPFFTLNWYPKISGKNLPLFLFRIATVFYNINFMNNFIVYGAMDKQYRTEVEKLFRCRV